MPNVPPRTGKLPNEASSSGTPEPARESAGFEEQLAELEKLVDQLERGDLTLEQSVTLFERGVYLSNACKEQLASAESRIQVLLDPERKGPVQVEDLALAVEEGEEESGDAENEEQE